MANPKAILAQLRTSDGKHAGAHIWVWCPGCDAAHTPGVRGDDGSMPAVCWEWDGVLEPLTISPSLLCHMSVHLCQPKDHHIACPNPDSCGRVGHIVLSKKPRILGHPAPHTAEPAWGPCHSFIRNGVWEFLQDCAHPLAGQHVPMVPLPDWLCRG